MGYFEETAFRGVTGTIHRFEVHDARAGFRDVGAVYVFARRNPSPAGGEVFLPLYVGQTAELGKQIRGHERWPCVEAAGCTSICVMAVADEERRREIEADLLGAYVTPCNER